ncbi:MAG: STAS domain-containing protein [Planctomycetota bacterium]
MSSLTLKHATAPLGATLITCAGVLDAHTSPELDQLIAELGAANPRVVIDIREVTYIASAGVGVFLGSVSTLRDAGGDLILVYPRHVEARESDNAITDGYDVLEVFNLLGLDQAIPVARSVADAEARFGV